MKIVPAKRRCRFQNCPIGLFLCGDTLALMTEYGTNGGQRDAFIVESGEYFWGGTHTDADRRKLLVTPCTVEAE